MRARSNSSRPGRSHRRLFLGLAVAAGLLPGACYSPTLPLPPPTRPEITLTETGAFRATGTVLPDAQVYTLNERSGAIDGQWVRGDGRYDFVLKDAEFEDPMQIWYQLGTDLSPTTRFALPKALPLPEEPDGAGGAGGATP
jgi:hypothetical protein